MKKNEKITIFEVLESDRYGNQRMVVLTNKGNLYYLFQENTGATVVNRIWKTEKIDISTK